MDNASLYSEMKSLGNDRADTTLAHETVDNNNEQRTAECVHRYYWWPGGRTERKHRSILPYRSQKDWVDKAPPKESAIDGQAWHPLMFLSSICNTNRRRGNEPDILEGDLVYLSTKTLDIAKDLARKLCPKYIGLYKGSVDKAAKSDSTLELPTALAKHGLYPALHIGLLRSYHASDDVVSQTAHPKPHDFGIDDEHEWFANEILGHRTTPSGGLEFKVRWSLGDTAPPGSLRSTAQSYLRLIGTWSCQGCPEQVHYACQKGSLNGKFILAILSFFPISTMQPQQPNNPTPNTNPSSAASVATDPSLLGPGAGPGGGREMDTSPDNVHIPPPPSQNEGSSPHHTLLSSIPTAYPQSWPGSPPGHSPQHHQSQYAPYAYPYHPPPQAAPYYAAPPTHFYAPPPQVLSTPKPRQHQNVPEASSSKAKGKRRETDQDQIQESHNEQHAVLLQRLRSIGLSDHAINAVDPYDESTVAILDEMVEIAQERDARIASLTARLERVTKTADNLRASRTSTGGGNAASSTPTATPSRKRGHSTSTSSASQSSVAQPSSASALPSVSGSQPRQATRPHPEMVPQPIPSVTSEPPHSSRSRQPTMTPTPPTPGPRAKRQKQDKKRPSTEDSPMADPPAPQAGPLSSKAADHQAPDTSHIGRGLYVPGAPGPHSDTCNYGEVLYVRFPTSVEPPRPRIADFQSPGGNFSSDTEDENEDYDSPKAAKRGKKKKKNVWQCATETTSRPVSDQEGCDGVISSFWGLWDSPIRTPEGRPSTRVRSNDMAGMLSRRYFWNRESNVVYAGESALEASRARFRGSSEVPDHLILGNALYKAARHGLPTTPREVDWLYKLMNRKSGVSPRWHAEAYQLLAELWRISEHTVPQLRDDSMRYLREELAFRPDIRPANLDYTIQYDPQISRHYSDARMSNPTNRTQGMGMNAPTGVHQLDLQLFARYLFTHHRPGSSNPINGLVFDHRRCLLWQSVIGLAICRILAPEDDTTRSAQIRFTRWFAVLVVTPNLYREHIARWNERHPDRPFVPRTGAIRYWRPLHMPEGQSANLSIDQVAEVLIWNGIEPELVDHIYPFGANYINHAYIGDPLHRSVFDEADNTRLQRLDQFGPPAVLLELGGWFEPNAFDILRAYWFEQREYLSHNVEMMDDDRLLLAGETGAVTLLRDRDYAPQLVQLWEGYWGGEGRMWALTAALPTVLSTGVTSSTSNMEVDNSGDGSNAIVHDASTRSSPPEEGEITPHADST
ncbi:hypothetical protein NP233_g7855 [Leucocoprinus birnbaumii]|uniref:Uncharacterized protein n=1 Tax=Leucocoprinus birnbaumii TaxID=56174 RepID=A0AAD5YPJ9_9AGAR|nr:hypothetical protein NP233_g7855 [Leucocoprinus birnbaumii]